MAFLFTLAFKVRSSHLLSTSKRRRTFACTSSGSAGISALSSAATQIDVLRSWMQTPNADVSTLLGRGTCSDAAMVGARSHRRRAEIGMRFLAD